MTCKPNPLTSGYRKLQLLYKKCIKLFPGRARPWLARINIKKTVCMYLCPSFTPEPPDQSPPNFVHTFTPTQGRFLTQV